MPETPSADEIERDLTFLGQVALADPPRPDVDKEFAACASAGIGVAMITGDHPATAKAIAVRLGIIGGDGGVITGADLLCSRQALSILRSWPWHWACLGWFWSRSRMRGLFRRGLIYQRS